MISDDLHRQPCELVPDGFGQRLSVGLLTALPFRNFVHAELYVRRADGRLGFVPNLGGLPGLRQGGACMGASREAYQRNCCSRYADKLQDCGRF